MVVAQGWFEKYLDFTTAFISAGIRIAHWVMALAIKANSLSNSY